MPPADRLLKAKRPHNRGAELGKAPSPPQVLPPGSLVLPEPAEIIVRARSLPHDVSYTRARRFYFTPMFLS